MSTWRTARLDEVAEVLGGGTPSRQEPKYFGGSIAWATPTDVTALGGLYISGAKESITEAGLKNSSTKLLPPGAVLLTSRATIGYTAVAKVPICTNQGFVNFICGPHLLPEYLAFWLRTQKDKMVQHAGGTTFKEIARGTLRKFEIPFPNINEQRRIVDLLSRAEGIVRLRHEAKKKAQAIIPALFLDMFGDPATNPKGWPRKQIRALGRVVTGTTPPSVNEGMFDGSIPFVTPGDLTRDTVRTGRFLTEAGAQKSRVVRSGATLVCCIGATIGKTDRTWVRSALNQQINAVEWSTEVDDEFGVECLRQSAHVVRTMGGQTALPILKKSLFEVIQVPIPPKSQQQLFAERVTILRSIVRQQVEAASVAEATFNALLGRAFSEGVLPFSEPTGGQVAA